MTAVLITGCVSFFGSDSPDAASDGDGSKVDADKIDSDIVTDCRDLTPLAPSVHLDFAAGSGQSVATGAPRVIRGVWEHAYSMPAGETAGMAEIASRITRMRAAGINMVSFLVPSNYLAAVLDPANHGAGIPTAAWDMFGRYMEEVRAAGMTVSVWYSPMILKEAERAHELVEHPEWELKSFDLEVPKTVDLASDEARGYQVELIAAIADRYHPDIIELEEPYYHELVAGTPITPTNATFAQRFMTRFGYPPTTSRPTRPADVATLKREILNQFFAEVRTAVLAADPAVAIHANIATQYATRAPLLTTGFDLPTLRKERLLDGFVPQLYYTTSTNFEDDLAGFESQVGGHMSIIAGLGAIVGDVTKANPGFVPQLTRSERALAQGAAGSSTFAYLYLDKVEAALAAKPVAELTGFLGRSAQVESSDPTVIPGPRLAGRGEVPALAFDGEDDVVTVPGAYALDHFGQFSFATWIRLEPGVRAAHETLVSRGQQDSSKGYLWIFRAVTGRLVYQFADGISYGAVNSEELEIDDGNWHHLAVVQDRASREVRFYLDGETRGISTYSNATVPVVSGDLWVGTYNGSNSDDYLFHGALADVRWYHRALTNADIAALNCVDAP